MKAFERGQVLLIVVLVMTVALTIGLSVATRTISNLRTSAEEENSQRAFSAAEAGIEQSLQSDTNSSGTFTNNTTYQASINTLAGTQFLLNNGAAILKDEVEDVWLSGYPNYTTPWTGTLTLYWGASDTCTTSEATNSMAAVEILVIYGTRAAPNVIHYVVDPCAARRNFNHFDAPVAGGGTIEGRALAHKRTITVTSGLIMRVIPLYAPAVMGVAGCDGSGGNCRALPAQGKLITSVGVADDTQRKIIGFQAYPKLPLELFPYILFSPR